ncbi:MAG: hypothetical protein ABL958_18485 [Bdellovibrionia bacterium]
MKAAAVIAFVLFASLFARAETKDLPVTAPGGVKAAGPAKVFEGPEGEEIIMVEANDSKFMLVQFKNIAGFEGTKLYNLDDQGSEKKDLYWERKRGSKTERRFVMSMRGGTWTFYHPVKNTEFSVSYSKKESKKVKAEDIVSTYKP